MGRTSLSHKLDYLLTELQSQYLAVNPKSEAQHAQSCEVIPGGGGSTRAVFFHHPFPIFMRSGKDCHVTSLDGQEYLDFLSGYNATMFGHSHPAILDAVQSTLSAGHTLGAPNDREGELARLLVDRIPSLDMVQLCNSGTEANMMAIAVAQNYTQKKKVLAFENGYHGSVTSFFPSSDPLRLLHPFVLGRFNDHEFIRQVVDEDIGVIILEPLQGAGGCVLATKAFPTSIRNEATRIGAILIFDEMVTSRLYYGGLQEYFDILPDMTTVGKFCGGGFSFGCYGGRRKIMKTMELSAARQDRIERTSQLGDDLRKEIQELVTEQHPGLVQVTGFGSAIGLHFERPESTRVREAMYYFFLQRAIYIDFRGFLSLNICHPAEHTQRVMQVLREFLSQLR
ncbi:aminotransferase class-III [Aspergillus brunneoviolaceus CBS 621.78]|uniref:Aminotransferase class-III n=1 Tax=Aspergillus brunneoviolaceus CBS 621.78 TaxID=1450534 RepID=A0ACD1FZV7_9EURO|nr:aminotransferase class-III [Aspergillus brunneoviolaceus CBS 621.78]RAH42488.1 aminotransferase class-III [Aspergillus brunneoviolaceus CBS 621.78]